MSKELKKQLSGARQISLMFQRRLSLCVIAAFLVTGVFTFLLQSKISETNSASLLRININDVMEDISQASDKNLLDLTYQVKSDMLKGFSIEQIAKARNIAEINVVDKNGYIIESTAADFLGYNMADGAQSSAFLVLLTGVRHYVQDYQPISYDTAISRKYAGVYLADGGFVQVGYDAVNFQNDIAATVVGATRNRHVGQNGCVMIADEAFDIVSDPHGNEGKNLAVTGIWIDEATMPRDVMWETEVYGKRSLCMYRVTEGYYIISVLPVTEAVFLRDLSVYITWFMETIVFVALFVLVYMLIKKLVVENIQKVNRSLSEITGGNLDVVVNVRGNQEFASLSDDINSTVLTLKRYIKEAAARIDQELAFAKAIQHAALPSVFPPYPNRREFEIFASMNTAKEVGGDFYDFYFVGEDRLAFLIADVSDKGIPAAMFMMTAKTLIKDYAETGRDVSEIFTLANEKLCENNDACMFVTAWLGILEVKTGLLEFVNAGHNPPFIKQGNGAYTCLNARSGLMLAGMEGISYRKRTLNLAPGDAIFLYTDGVTEARNSEEQFYGEERLARSLNEEASASAQALCQKIAEDVDAFVGDAAQFDDITMLSLQYFGA